jgi:hypothetical protein
MLPSPRLALLAVLVLAPIAGCYAPGNGVFAEPGERGLVCAQTMDRDGDKVGDLELGLDEARRRGAIVQLYGHSPDGTVSVARIEGLLAAAADRGMPFVTYQDMAAGTAPGGSLALGFDDAHVDAWHALRPLLDGYRARVTFFVTRFPGLAAEQRAKLHELADDGHAIEYHGTDHKAAAQYVAEHGLDAWLRDEIEPGLAAMRADGFAPAVFAYPFGDRSDETDRALLEQFTIVRGSAHDCD